MNLSLLFLHELLAAKLMPPARAELGRWVLLDAIFDDPDGNLTPSAKELDSFLTRFFGMILPRPARCVAFLELLPHWLRFLARRGIITAKLVDERLAALEGVVKQSKLLVSDFSLPTLMEPLEGWPGQRRDR